MEIKSRIISAAALFSLLLSSAALPAQAAVVKAPAAADAFCSNLPSLTSQVTDKLTNAENNITARQQQHLTDLKNLQQDRAQKLSDLRAQETADRETIYAKLEAKATTDAEKTAVTAFESSVNSAAGTRTAAVDAATQAYWNSLDSIMTARQGQVQTAAKNFGTAVQQALSSASGQCAAGTASATVRQQFTSAIQTARDQFQTARQGIDKSGQQLKTAVQTRNSSVQQAVDAFQSSLKSAEATLKAAFPSA